MHFEEQAVKLQEYVGEEYALWNRVQNKIDHYLDVFEAVQSATDDLIWTLCQANQIPPPGTPDRWATRQPFGDFNPNATSTPQPRSLETTLHTSLPIEDNVREQDEQVTTQSMGVGVSSQVSGISPRTELTQPMEQSQGSQAVSQPPIYTAPRSLLDRPQVVPSAFRVQQSSQSTGTTLNVLAPAFTTRPLLNPTSSVIGDPLYNVSLQPIQISGQTVSQGQTAAAPPLSTGLETVQPAS